VLLEAMACSRAIVTTNVPGCRDAVKDGYNGLLVPVKSVQVLASAIMKLLENPKLRALMGQNGRSRAISEFSQEYVSSATLDIYHQLLER